MITINIMAIGAFIFKVMATIVIVSLVMAIIFGVLSEFTCNILIDTIRDISLGVCGVILLAGMGLLMIGIAIAIIFEIWA